MSSLAHDKIDFEQLAGASRLILGIESYAEGLGAVLGTEVIHPDLFHAAPPAAAVKHKPLRDLRQVLLAVAQDESSRDALRHHQRLCDWLETLSPDGEWHRFAFVFITSSDASEGFERAIASSLCVEHAQLHAAGHAVWRRSGELPQLLELLKRVKPQPYRLLKCRRRDDVRAIALRQLLQSVQHDDSTAAAAANAVLEAFGKSLYDLDHFCRTPNHHSHGAELRRWLQAHHSDASLGAWLDVGCTHLPQWLDLQRLCVPT